MLALEGGGVGHQVARRRLVVEVHARNPLDARHNLACTNTNEQVHGFTGVRCRFITTDIHSRMCPSVQDAEQ